MFAWALKLQHITARVPLFQPALPALKVEFELRSEFERERERESVRVRDGYTQIETGNGKSDCASIVI